MFCPGTATLHLIFLFLNETEAKQKLKQNLVKNIARMFAVVVDKIKTMDLVLKS